MPQSKEEHIRVCVLVNGNVSKNNDPFAHGAGILDLFLQSVYSMPGCVQRMLSYPPLSSPVVWVPGSHPFSRSITETPSVEEPTQNTQL